MTGVFLLALTFLIVFIGVRSNFQPFRFVSSFAWFIPVGYLTLSPPTLLPAHSALQVICIVICIGLMVIQMIWTFRKNLQVRSETKDKYGNYSSTTEDREGWHLPGWMNGESEEQRITRIRQERREKRSEYRERFREALKGKERED
jgi:hypothetical protein